MTEADLGDFLTEYTANNRPGALNGVLKVFDQNVNGGMSRHEALVLALPMAYREAIAGCYRRRLPPPRFKKPSRRVPSDGKGFRSSSADS
ncbi:hypothetical protein GS887_27835 [Rhodococcus hoagii]|nr:hypothetical protein [Prescottella equi]